MPRRKTNVEFLTEMAERQPTILVLEEYKGTHVPISCKCLKEGCGCEFCAEPNDMLHGHGCPRCGGTKKKTDAEFKEYMASISPNIIVLGTYVNDKAKILCECKIDGHQWETMPHHLVKGHGCPVCGWKDTAKSETLSNEEFLERIHKVNPYVQPLEEYKGAKVKIKCLCTKDNYIWSTSPACLWKGYGCPKCTQSKNERIIAAFLDEHLIRYICEYRFPECRNIHALPFDFYLPDLNMCIEFDGEQHVRPNDFFGGEEAWESLQYRDSLKTSFCEENGIRLVRIPFDAELPGYLRFIVESEVTA
jgi:very-short-patch-repair endonuclease